MGDRKRTLPMGRRRLNLYAGIAIGASAGLQYLDDELGAATSCSGWKGENPSQHDEILADVMKHIGRAIGEIDLIVRRLGDLAQLFDEAS